MGNIAKRGSLCFSAGALGALINSWAVWYFGTKGIPASFNVNIAPHFSPPWLYPRIVWGGIWGLLFLLPVLKNRFLSRGLLFSLGPTLVQLFIIFPMKAHQGVMGLTLGMLTPIFVFLYNAIWGFAAAIWLRSVDK